MTRKVVRRCTTCHCPLESDERSTCPDCKETCRWIAAAHRLAVGQAEYDRTEPARCEARLLFRGRVGS